MKLQKIGNSYMVTIPKTVKDAANLKIGDEVEVLYLTDEKAVQIKPKSKKKNRGKSILDMAGTLSIPNFDYKQSMKDIKEGAYERLNLP